MTSSSSAMEFVAPKAEKSTFVTAAATVSIQDGKVRICYLDRYNTKEKPPVMTKEINFSDGQKCKVYEFSELPMQFSAEDEGAEVVLRVKSEGSKIVEFLPENEDDITARFVDFYRPGGTEASPAFFEKDKWNKDDPYEANVLQFCAKFKIEGGIFDGKFTLGYFQGVKSGISKKEGHRPYEFSTFPKSASGNVGLGFAPLPNGTTGQVWSDLVYGLRHCGLLEGEPMPYPEDGNPLPQIEKKLQQANRLVKLEIHKGYVTGISSPKKLAMRPAPEVHEPGIIDRIENVLSNTHTKDTTPDPEVM